MHISWLFVSWLIDPVLNVCVCVPSLTELFLHKPDPFLFVQIIFLIALLFYDNSAPGLEDLPSPTGHSTGWCVSVAGDKGICQVWAQGQQLGCWPQESSAELTGLKKAHKGIEGFLSYCSAIGRSKRERKDQFPLKERGREASPAGLTHCSLLPKIVQPLSFPCPVVNSWISMGKLFLGYTVVFGTCTFCISFKLVFLGLQMLKTFWLGSCCCYC